MHDPKQIWKDGEFSDYALITSKEIIKLLFINNISIKNTSVPSQYVRVRERCRVSVVEIEVTDMDDNKRVVTVELRTYE